MTVLKSKENSSPLWWLEALFRGSSVNYVISWESLIIYEVLAMASLHLEIEKESLLRWKEWKALELTARFYLSIAEGIKDKPHDHFHPTLNMGT